MYVGITFLSSYACDYFQNIKIWKNLAKMLIAEIPSSNYFYICFFKFPVILQRVSQLQHY